MSRPARPWFRFYTEAPTDMKIRRLTPVQRWLWVCVLGLARQSPHPGVLMLTEDIPSDTRDLAWYADIPECEVVEGIAVLARLGLIAVTDNGVWTVTKWDERQYEGDFSRQKIAPELRDAVLARDGSECQECGSTEDLTIDHITPRTRGGATELANLQVLCRVCNARKGNRIRQKTHRERNANRNAVTSESHAVTAPDAETEGESGAIAPTRRRGKTAIPSPFTISERNLEWVRVTYPTLDFDLETQKLVAWAKANDRRYADWDQAWRNWMHRAAEKKPW